MEGTKVSSSDPCKCEDQNPGYGGMCKNCGNPYWRHSHYLTVRANPSGFGGKPFRKIITEEEAIACYYKWGS